MKTDCTFNCVESFQGEVPKIGLVKPNVSVSASIAISATVECGEDTYGVSLNFAHAGDKENHWDCTGYKVYKSGIEVQEADVPANATKEIVSKAGYFERYFEDMSNDKKIFYIG